VSGTSDVAMITDNNVGGGADNWQFDWTKFPQAPGSKYDASSLSIKWARNGVIAQDNYSVQFSGYGIFVISKFVTPDDDMWTGGTENVAFNVNGTGATRSVHTDWITRVKNQEGVGMSKNTIYGIHTTSPGAPVRYYLSAQNEGAFVPRLSVNHSLAKSTADTRFAKRDHILLPTTDQGITFSIDDSGNWVELGEGTINQFDRFAGVVGPNDPNAAFPSSYVVKPK
jgi:hypothetical protein